MSLEFTPTRSRRNLHMETLRDVLGIVAEIDDILGREFGGKGRGIHSKLDSVYPPLPTPLNKRLRYIEAVRNKALMQPDWRIPNRTVYVSECLAAAQRLRRIAQKRERRRRVLAPFQRLRGTPGWFVIVLCTMGALMLLTSGAIAFSP